MSAGQYRDPEGVALGVLCLVVGAGTSLTALSADGWWQVVLVVSVPLFLIGLYGFVLEMARRPHR